MALISWRGLQFQLASCDINTAPVFMAAGSNELFYLSLPYMLQFPCFTDLIAPGQHDAQIACRIADTHNEMHDTRNKGDHRT